MKIPVGVVGFGNLGKAVAKTLSQSDEFKLVAVFSKRNLDGTVSFSKVDEYKDKIKILFVCGGSQNELEEQTLNLIKNFNTIDCYDNHDRLKGYISKMDRLAKENKKVALCALGWDPGLFSLMRGLFSALGFLPYTFWGKGLSQGHTQAVKNIPGVIDALQFTIPSKKYINKIKNGKRVAHGKHLHMRECFVVANKNDRAEIEKQIRTMKNYFEGYKTSVKFVSQQKLDKMKSFKHKGEVVSQNNVMNFSLNLKSNPNFTAKVMVRYAKNFITLLNENNFGAYTILDLPIKNIMDKNKSNLL